MPEAVYRMLTLLCALVVGLPVGTNLGLLHLLWMLVSGRLLAARGAMIPGLNGCGLSRGAVRRVRAALGQGHWTSERLLAQWARLMAGEGRWQARTHGGYHPVPVDVTAFWRPRLRGCPTTHYSAEAGKALPALPVGLVARMGEVGGQRLGLPLALVPAEDARPTAHARVLVRVAVAQCAADDVLVCDAGFPLAVLQEEGAERFVGRLATNATFRRATPPAYRGRGRPPTRGVLVRPLSRAYRGRTLAATLPDAEVSWEEEARVPVRAAVWPDLVLPTAGPGAPTLTGSPRRRQLLEGGDQRPVRCRVVCMAAHRRLPYSGASTKRPTAIKSASRHRVAGIPSCVNSRRRIWKSVAQSISKANPNAAATVTQGRTWAIAAGSPVSRCVCIITPGTIRPITPKSSHMPRKRTKGVKSSPSAGICLVNFSHCWNA